MEKFWIIFIAVAIFLASSFFFYLVVRSFTREKFGQNWLKKFNNKLYFWQSVLFMSTACTALVLYLLKAGDALNF